MCSKVIDNDDNRQIVAAFIMKIVSSYPEVGVLVQPSGILTHSVVRSSLSLGVGKKRHTCNKERWGIARTLGDTRTYSLYRFRASRLQVKAIWFMRTNVKLAVCFHKNTTVLYPRRPEIRTMHIL